MEQTMATSNPDSPLEVADRLFTAIERGDLEAVRSIYSPDVKIWHNNDGVTQTREQNLAVLKWLIENVADRGYTDARRQQTPTGFVQQHVMRGKLKASGREFSLPACIICTVEGGRITRLDEYLDSAHIAALRG
jgi:ketosteroid isomerase-like protein